MPRQATFETTTDPSQFGPEQIRPRALLALSISGLAHWFAANLVPYPRLLGEHRTGLVFTTVQLDYSPPALRFAEADWLTVASRVSVSDSAKYLSLDVHIRGRRHTEAPPNRQVARFHADLRAVTIVEDRALTAIPGVLAGRLFDLFEPDEVYRPDRDAIARASTPPAGDEIFADGGEETILRRSHCEVGDQWSFIEVLELVTAARERLFRAGSVPRDVGKLAVAHPTARIAASFQRAMYVFDTCRISTRVIETPGEEGGVAFVYEVSDAERSMPCVTAWELLAGQAISTPSKATQREVAV